MNTKDHPSASDHTRTHLANRNQSTVNRTNLGDNLQGAGIVGLVSENGVDSADARAMLPSLKKANEEYAAITPDDGWE